MDSKTNYLLNPRDLRAWNVTAYLPYSVTRDSFEVISFRARPCINAQEYAFSDEFSVNALTLRGFQN